MKTFLFVALCSVSAFAVPNVVVYVDNLAYQCTQGGNPGPNDPNCIQKISKWCDDNTTLSGNDCFNKAAQECAGSKPGYSDCVISTAEYCDNNTTMSSADCFAKATAACKGRAEDLISLFEGVKAKR